jgi:hypothetical protein
MPLPYSVVDFSISYKTLIVFYAASLLEQLGAFDFYL